EAGLRARGRRTGRVLPPVRRFPGNAQCFMAKVVSTYRCGAAPASTRGSYRLPFQTYRSIKIKRYVPWRAGPYAGARGGSSGRDACPGNPADVVIAARGSGPIQIGAPRCRQVARVSAAGKAPGAPGERTHAARAGAAHLHRVRASGND